MKSKNKLNHVLPFWENKDSKILILGTFPSVDSINSKFYYAHKGNDFWKFIQKGLNTKEELDSPEKAKDYCLKHHIALYDVIESCYSKMNKNNERSSKDNDLQIIESSKDKILNFIHTHENLKYIAVISQKASLYFHRLIWPYVAKSNIIVLSFLPSTSGLNRGNPKLQIFKSANEQLINQFYKYLRDAAKQN